MNCQTTVLPSWYDAETTMVMRVPIPDGLNIEIEMKE